MCNGYTAPGMPTTKPDAPANYGGKDFLYKPFSTPRTAQNLVMRHLGIMEGRGLREMLTGSRLDSPPIHSYLTREAKPIAMTQAERFGVCFHGSVNHVAVGLWVVTDGFSSTPPMPPCRACTSKDRCQSHQIIAPSRYSVGW